MRRFGLIEKLKAKMSIKSTLKEIIEKVINDSSLTNHQKATNLNLPKDKEFVLNSNEIGLHVRSYWPSNYDEHSNKKPTAAIIYLHGYVAHTSRPIFEPVAKTFTDANLVFITLDFHGHGFSEGLKAYIGDYVDLVDDVVSLLMALYSGPVSTNHFQIKHN